MRVSKRRSPLHKEFTVFVPSLRTLALTATLACTALKGQREPQLTLAVPVEIMHLADQLTCRVAR